MFNRKWRTSKQLIDEIRHWHAKDARAAVIDDDRDVQRCGGRLDPDDLPNVTAFFDGRLAAGEVGDRRVPPVDRTDVHRPYVRDRNTPTLRGRFNRPQQDRHYEA